MQTKAALVREAYIDAEALVKRCLHRSHCFWNEQQVCAHGRLCVLCHCRCRSSRSYTTLPLKQWGLQCVLAYVVLQNVPCQFAHCCIDEHSLTHCLSLFGVH